MNEKHIYTLLKVVNSNANVKLMTRIGLTFSKIADLTNYAINEGYLEHTKEKIVLSKKGFSKFKELDTKLKNINKEEWIEKDIKSIVPKLDKSIMFVPKQNELTF